VRLLLLGSTAALALTAQAAAQTPGLAIHGAGLPGGIHVGATAGLSGSSSWPGEAFALGASLGFSSGRIGVVGTVGRIDFDADPFESSLTVGVRGVLRLFGGGLDIPLQVDAFAGYGRFDEPDERCLSCPIPWSARGAYHVPAGLGLTLNLSTPVFSIRPWLAPRVELFTGLSGDVGVTETDWAASAGVDLRFLGGLGLTVAWDKIEHVDQIIGFGVTYRF